MKINKLPKNIVNILSAGEVVERPYSVVKELVENSIDAGANEIVVEIQKGGNELIKVQDNGEGVFSDDIENTIKEYATSKINKIEDVYSIDSFGFRGEALSTISEVSFFTIQTKTKQEQIGTFLKKNGNDIQKGYLNLNFEHGTCVIVNKLFYNLPVRRKFLKTQQTEFKYIEDLFIKFAIKHFDKFFKLIHNGKIIKQYQKSGSLLERIKDIYPSFWENNFIFLDYSDENYSVYGVFGNGSLKFTSNMIKIFVNSRNVKDKIIQKAIMNAYNRQIEPGMYPFAVIFVEGRTDLIDVNVHPRKEEIKFIDPGNVYNLVNNLVKKQIENKDYKNINSNSFAKKAAYVDFGKCAKNSLKVKDLENVQKVWGNYKKDQNLDLEFNQSFYYEKNKNQSNVDVNIIGQIFDSYILFQKKDDFFIADQHAIAERILFEKMKKEYNKNDLSLLSMPVKLEIKNKIDDKINSLKNIGFDIDYFGENKVVVYSVPKILEKYKVDISMLLNSLINSEDIDIFKILDQIFATKSCKASIKANKKLSFEEMKQLLEDGQKFIEGFFVCQHGRNSIVKLSKHDIDNFFNRT